jgi:Flagellar motor switch protein
MPTMEIVNERFARNFRIGLFNFIRRSPEVSVGTVTVQRYSAFLRRLAVPTNFNIVAIRPLRGNGLIVCEPSLVFGIIDTLYGGAGRLQTRIEGRDFSATEQRVINRLVDVISEEYKKAGTAFTRWSWLTSARKCSRSLPTLPLPVKLLCLPRSSWKLAMCRALSMCACPTPRWSPSATSCTRPPKATPWKWTAAG